MTFTFDDARDVCSRLRDRDGDVARQLSELLATCVYVGQWTDGLEGVLDAQVDEEECCTDLLRSALTDLTTVMQRIAHEEVFYKT